MARLEAVVHRRLLETANQKGPLPIRDQAAGLFGKKGERGLQSVIHGAAAGASWPAGTGSETPNSTSEGWI